MARHLATTHRRFTLFATHYFELTALANELAGVVNLHLDATEHGDELVFLHAVREGPANRSYGLAVAQLAGVPQPVIAAARRYLVELEAQRDALLAAAPTPQASLPFDQPAGPDADREVGTTPRTPSAMPSPHSIRTHFRLAKRTPSCIS